MEKWKLSNKDKSLIYAMGIISLIAVILSYYQQYYFNNEPCEICKLERLPYLIAVLFTPVMAILESKSIKYVLTLLAINCMFLGLVALIHLGFQYSFINFSCSVISATSFEEFDKLLYSQNNPCSDINWKFLGIPVSFYNILFAIFGIVLIQGIKYKNRSKKLTSNS